LTDSNLCFEDSAAPVWMIVKTGYYQVGTKYFVHKTNALIEASRTKQEVRWEFNSDVYNSVDWRTPCTLSILELYRMRAQQLRDKYDYLIVTFSGGADSSNVVDSFLLNGIHIDEIVCHWPLKATQGKYKVSTDTSQYNVLSEWELAAKPKLDYIRKHYPKVKITITDTDEFGHEDNEEIITLTRDKLDYASLKRFKAIFNLSSKLISKGLKVATVFGADKPNITMTKNVFCCRFNDGCGNTVSDLIDGYERNVEYFYWTPDLPEISVKQGQILYNYFKNYSNLRYLLGVDNTVLVPGDYKKITTHTDSQLYRSIISELLYPSWNAEIFQADKPENFIKSEHHAWTRDRGQQYFLESWESAVMNYFNQIDKKFFLDPTNLNKGYDPFYSRSYPIGAF
jgi:hypothetical protein